MTVWQSCLLSGGKTGKSGLFEVRDPIRNCPKVLTTVAAPEGPWSQDTDKDVASPNSQTFELQPPKS